MDSLEFRIHAFVGNQYFCGQCAANWGFPGASVVENSPVKQETQGRSLGLEDPLEKGMGTHSSILAWEIPWTEEPGVLHPMGSQELVQLSDRAGRHVLRIACQRDSASFRLQDIYSKYVPQQCPSPCRTWRVPCLTVTLAALDIFFFK